MRSKIQKWGHSLAVRIPKGLAEEATIRENTRVEITVQDEALMITPIRRRASLRSLLDQVTEENLHGEIT